MVVIESAGITDVGQKRKGNEDALYLNDDIKLYIVADGMGGHQAGEVASSLAVDAMQGYMSKFAEDNDAEELEDTNQDLSAEAGRILSSIYMANKSVYQVSKTEDSYRGMGSTVSVVFFSDNTLIAANVGDSPIYLVHNGKIELLSVPHTVLAEQAAMDPEGVKLLENKFKHVLTRAIGVEETVAADICEIQGFKDDILVIASDGLSDKVSPEEIQDVVSIQHPDKACRLLVDLANERGGDDNITVIVLKIKKTLKKTRISGAFSWVADKIFN